MSFVETISSPIIFPFSSMHLKAKRPGGGGGGVLGSIFAGYVPLASRNPYPIKVYSVAKL